MSKPATLQNLTHFLLAFLTLTILNVMSKSLFSDFPRLAQISGISMGGLKGATFRAESGRGFEKQEISVRLRLRLQSRIKRELVQLPDYDVFDNIDFSIDSNQVVTLVGDVRSPSLKTNAAKAVNSIEGVRRVVDKLEVLPASPLDDRIRRVAFFKIYWQAQLRPFLSDAPSIHIIVKQGNLTLEGVVTTESEKLLAGLRANQVPCVFKVINNLRARGPGHDEEYLAGYLFPPNLNA